MESRIIAALTLAFAPSELIVEDDSESHRGHGGYKEGGETHFNVRYVQRLSRGCHKFLLTELLCQN